MNYTDLLRKQYEDIGNDYLSLYNKLRKYEELIIFIDGRIDLDIEHFEKDTSQASLDILEALRYFKRRLKVSLKATRWRLKNIIKVTNSVNKKYPLEEDDPGPGYDEDLSEKVMLTNNEGNEEDEEDNEE